MAKIPPSPDPCVPHVDFPTPFGIDVQGNAIAPLRAYGIVECLGTWASGWLSGWLNNRYLRLDTANDPLLSGLHITSGYSLYTNFIQEETTGSGVTFLDSIYMQDTLVMGLNRLSFRGSAFAAFNVDLMWGENNFLYLVNQGGTTRRNLDMGWLRTQGVAASVANLYFQTVTLGTGRMYFQVPDGVGGRTTVAWGGYTVGIGSWFDIPYAGNIDIINNRVLTSYQNDGTAISLGDATNEGGDIEVYEDAVGDLSLYFDADTASLTIGGNTELGNVTILGKDKITLSLGNLWFEGGDFAVYRNAVSGLTFYIDADAGNVRIFTGGTLDLDCNVDVDDIETARNPQNLIGAFPVLYSGGTVGYVPIYSGIV